MLGTLFDWVRDIKERLFCRTCNYKSLFAISLIYHLKKAHNIKPTKKDYSEDKFARRFYCEHARLNQLRADKKASKRKTRRKLNKIVKKDLTNQD